MSNSRNDYVTIGIRVTKAEKDCFEGLAKARGCTVTDIMRSAVKRTCDEIRHPESQPLEKALAEHSASIKNEIKNMEQTVRGLHGSIAMNSWARPEALKGLYLTPALKQDVYWGEIVSLIVFVAIAELFSTKGMEWIPEDIPHVIESFQKKYELMEAHSEFLYCELCTALGHIPLDIAKAYLTNPRLLEAKYSKFGVAIKNASDSEPLSWEEILL